MRLGSKKFGNSLDELRLFFCAPKLGLQGITLARGKIGIFLCHLRLLLHALQGIFQRAASVDGKSGAFLRELGPFFGLLEFNFQSASLAGMSCRNRFFAAQCA